MFLERLCWQWCVPMDWRQKGLKADVLCLSVLDASMVARDMKFNFKKENAPLPLLS